MRVGVVGMGAAGLYAARLLQKAGVEVECFEARDRVGGRLHTISDASGNAFDVGGEWIDRDHWRVYQLVPDVGCEFNIWGRPPGRVFYRSDWRPEDELWPNAKDDERRFDDAAEELCRSLDSDGSRLAGRTLQSLIDDCAEWEIGNWWLQAKCRSDEGEEPDRIGLVGWLEFYRHYLDRPSGAMSAFRVKGGMAAIMDRVAEQLAGPISLGQVLDSVEEVSERVVLHFGRTVREFDRVVITMPIPCLKSIEFHPPFARERQIAFGCLAMGRSIKIALEFERAWWHEAGWAGSLHSDTILQQVWEGHIEGRFVLNVYICGDAADKVRNSEEPVELVVKELTEQFPQARTHFKRGVVADWIADPYSQGGFPHSTPADPGNAWQTASRPHGRVHFAGDWAASWMGFVEGALESAERVVQEILNA